MNIVKTSKLQQHGIDIVGIECDGDVTTDELNAYALKHDTVTALMIGGKAVKLVNPYDLRKPKEDDYKSREEYLELYLAWLEDTPEQFINAMNPNQLAEHNERIEQVKRELAEFEQDAEPEVSIEDKIESVKANLMQTATSYALKRTYEKMYDAGGLYKFLEDTHYLGRFAMAEDPIVNDRQVKGVALVALDWHDEVIDVIGLANRNTLIIKHLGFDADYYPDTDWTDYRCKNPHKELLISALVDITYRIEAGLEPGLSIREYNLKYDQADEIFVPASKDAWDYFESCDPKHLWSIPQWGYDGVSLAKRAEYQRGLKAFGIGGWQDYDEDAWMAQFKLQPVNDVSDMFAEEL